MRLEKNIHTSARKYAWVLLFVMMCATLAMTAQGDGWTSDKPSHQTLYANTLTSKTDASDVTVADNFGVTGDSYVLGGLGIGISAPAEELHVVSTGPILRLEDSDATMGSGSQQALVQFHAGSDLIGQVGFNTGAANMGIVQYQDAPLLFQTNGSTRQTIDGSGNIGIGTTSPSQIGSGWGPVLDVSGDAPQLVLHDLSPGALDWAIGNSQGKLHFRDSSATRMTIDSSNGYIGIGTSGPTEKLEVSGNILAEAYLYPSDRDLKKDIRPLEDALGKLSGVEGVSFRWRESGGSSIGMIAQEMENAYPELVHDTRKGKTIDYVSFTAVLLQAVKELEQQNKEQDEQIRQLREELGRRR